MIKNYIILKKIDHIRTLIPTSIRQEMSALVITMEGTSSHGIDLNNKDREQTPKAFTNETEPQFFLTLSKKAGIDSDNKGFKDKSRARILRLHKVERPSTF
jgi:hypothetical protein